MTNHPRKLQEGKNRGQWLPHFLPLLRRFRKQLCWALLAMVVDASLTVFRPWPLKVVIDRVLSHDGWASWQVTQAFAAPSPS